MPRFTWKEDEPSRALMFFPFVGALIGALILLVNRAGLTEGCPLAVRVLLTLVIPILLTGGIHIDGYMDTEDALRSYASPERRLEILKDPHIGAFAVIGLLKLLLILGAAMILILEDAEGNPADVRILASIFVTARCFSGLTSLLYPKARKEGMLYETTKGDQKTAVATLIIELAAVSAFMLAADPARGIAVLLAFVLCAAYYRVSARRAFGGVTGDTAGHFLVISETAAVAVLAACTRILR